MSKEHTPQGFKERLKKARSDAGFTQAGVQAELMLRGWTLKSKAAVGHWETGHAQPDLATLVELGKMFEVSIDWLLKGDQVSLIDELSLDDESLTKIRSLNSSRMVRLRKSLMARVDELLEDMQSTSVDAPSLGGVRAQGGAGQVN